MENNKKKIIAGVTLGALLVVGGISMLTAEAKFKRNDCPDGSYGYGHHGKHGYYGMNNMPPAEDISKNLSEQFGVAASDVDAAIEANRDLFDIGQAAMLANITGKSFNEILDLKTNDNHWRDIKDSLGVTREDIRAQMREADARKLAFIGNMDKELALQLLDKGYDRHDIHMASLLANASNKDVQSILDMKRINNSWNDVADEMGVELPPLEFEHRGPHCNGNNDRQGKHDRRGGYGQGYQRTN